MKILLDEMYTGLVPFLKALGWEVTSIEELGLKGADDLEVVAHSKNGGFLLVTQDHKIAELASLRGVPCVVIGSAEIAKIIDQKLRAKLEGMQK